MTVTSIIYYTFDQNTQTILKFSTRLLDSLSQDAIHQIMNRFIAMERAVLMGGNVVNSVDQVRNNDPNLLKYLLGTNKNLKDMEAVGVGTEEGDYIEISDLPKNAFYRTAPNRRLPREAAVAIRYIIRSIPDQPPIERWNYVDDAGAVIETEDIPATHVRYDPRSDSWYKRSIDLHDQVWTDVIESPLSFLPAIATAYPIRDAQGKTIGAIKTSITLNSLSSILSASKVTKDSTVIIVDRMGNVVAHPNLSQMVRTEKSKISLMKVEDLNDQTEAKAFRHFVSTKEKTFMVENEQGKKYIAIFKPFGFGLHDFGEWEFSALVPLQYFVQDMLMTEYITFSICAVIILISALIIIWLANRLASPILALSNQADRIKNFNLEEGGDEVNTTIKELNILQASVTAMRHSLISFARFVPKKFVKKLIDKGIEVKVGGRPKVVTMFFSDIESFTSASEGYPADKLMHHLSDYFDEISCIIEELDGTVDKFIGDSVMAFWGAPSADKRHAYHACQGALLCQKRLFDLNHQWAYEKKPVFKTRIGIHSDEVLLGNLGSSERLNYTIIGDGVNVASRLEGVNKLYKTQVIISEKTYHDVVDYAVARTLGFVRVKGRAEPVKIYELMALKNSDHAAIVPTQDQIDLCAQFEHAFVMYAEKQWDLAIAGFQSILKNFPHDTPTEIYLAHCEALKANPPGDDWDSAIDMTVK